MSLALTTAAAPTQAQDHISRLPTELLHHIISYLFNDHIHDAHLFSREASSLYQPYHSRVQYGHTLRHFALTCKHIRSEVNAWAVDFLLQHKSLTHYKIPKTPTPKTVPLDRLLTWTTRHCNFCGRKSVRRATFISNLACCRQCDERQWPHKITKTLAKTEFGLKDEQLLQSRGDPGVTRDARLPLIRRGTANTMGVQATMFLKQDVEKLAVSLHGDMDKWREMREVKRLERLGRAILREQERLDAEWVSEQYWTSARMWPVQ